MIEDYINLCNRIAAEFETMYGVKPDGVPAIEQFNAIANGIELYRDTLAKVTEMAKTVKDIAIQMKEAGL